MIKSVEIKNFKSVSHLNLSCKGFNLITGTNSSGKSTFMQSLLLIKQNANQDVGLNGEVISVGDFREIKNFNISSNEISFKVDVDENSFDLLIHEDGIEKNNLLSSPSFIKRIEYLSCNRIGAEDMYKKNYSANMSVGINGEYTVFCLNKYGNKRLDDEIVHDFSDYTLLSQVNHWLEYILDSTVSTEEIPGTDYYKCFFNVNNTKEMRPKNVGAGLSYIISVLTMCLISEKNDVLVIENPEIHLHPRAQSKLCEFLYFVSQGNRQIFVESHSDHIFNAIRAGIATGKMNKDSITINFFNMNDNSTVNNVIIIGTRGRIENYIEGLFDQFDMDLDKMLGL